MVIAVGTRKSIRFGKISPHTEDIEVKVRNRSIIWVKSSLVQGNIVYLLENCDRFLVSFYYQTRWSRIFIILEAIAYCDI